LLRENILGLYDIGVLDHTVAAFWQYLIHIEILLKLREKIVAAPQRLSKTLASDIPETIGEIDRLLDASKTDTSGDFTSRLSALVKSIVLELDVLRSRHQLPSAQQLTNIIFRMDLRSARALIEKCVKPTSIIFFLFDNIDKGWSAGGVQPHDVRLARLLIESLNRMQRDLGRHTVKFDFLVFIRNDIYELLIDQTPDRGKEGQILIDWSDREQLKRIILERMRYSLEEDFPTFADGWHRFFIPNVDGIDSFEYLASRCLMRPRFLIDLIENCIRIAVNRGHEQVSDDDLKAACRQHSYYFISDFGYEIRDVSSVTHDLFYAFIGIGELVTYDEVAHALAEAGIKESERDHLIQLLLWYGFLGLGLASDKKVFIYDVEYDFKRLIAQTGSRGNTLYCINPAFIDGLMN
jgi:hypothetical protein